jgi:hypothetical protein
VGFFAQIVAASVVSWISGVGELLDKIDDGSPKLRIRARMDALGELGTIRGLIWCGERRCLRRFFEGLAGRDELGTLHGRGRTRAATQAHHILEAGRPRRRVTAPRSAAGLRCLTATHSHATAVRDASSHASLYLQARQAVGTESNVSAMV